jgi:hypothetical protein
MVRLTFALYVGIVHSRGVNVMKILKVLFVLLAVTTLATIGYCEQTVRTGRLLDMEGSVDVRMADGKTVPADIGMELTQGDIIKTGSDSFALVKLDGLETATVEINANSQMLISELIMDKEAGTQKTLLDLAIGKVLIKADKLHSDSSRFEVKTPTSVVGVRGTTFAVEVEGLE